MIQVNLTAVVAASAAAMAVGYLWYSSFLFGKLWMKLEGLSKETMKTSGMAKTYLIMFMATLVSGYILSLFIHYAGAFTLVNGAKTGLWAWIGFVLPTGLANHLFSKKPLQLFLLQTGHHLAGLLVMGAILATWY